MSLTNNGTRRLTPTSKPYLQAPQNGLIMVMVNWSINSIYKCQNKQELVKYYHSSLGLHPKSTLDVAARESYL